LPKEIYTTHYAMSSHHRQLHDQGIMKKFSQYTALRSHIGLTIIVMTLVILGVRQLGVFQSFELGVYDRLVHLSPDTPHDPRMLIVSIGENDIQTLQNWPIPDNVIAEVINNLQAHHPAVIGLDIHRDIPYEPGTDQLTQVLRESDNIIGIEKYGSVDEADKVPPPSAIPSTRIGFNDLVLDSDGVVRRHLMYMQDGQNILTAFAVQVAQKYLIDKGVYPQAAPDNPRALLFGHALFEELQATSGGYQIEDSSGFQVLLKYRSRNAVARKISLLDVRDGHFEPEWVTGKIVLIGSTAASLKDTFFTPYSKTAEQNFYMSGVLIHAQKISQLLTAVLGSPSAEQQIVEPEWNWGYYPLFQFWQEWLEMLWIAGWSVLGGLLFTTLHRPWKLVIFSLVSFSGLAILTYSLFNYGYWIPSVTPFIGFSLTGFAVLVARLIYTALHDEVTQLPNRALFSQYIQRQRRELLKNPQGKPAQDQQFAVILLDFDDFKIIKSVLGSSISNALSLAITERIRSEVNAFPEMNRRRYALARISADKFAILLKQPVKTATVMSIANTLQEHLMNCFNLQQQEEIFANMHAGIAFGDADFSRDLLQDAHAAMYRAKTTSKNNPEVFETTMETIAIQRFHLERDLRQAVTRLKRVIEQGGFTDEFIVYYQPLISLETGQILGFEALVRWQHPRDGIVSPGKFIPVAEETGLIVPIGEAVLRRACQQVCRWRTQFPEYSELLLSVNLSGKQFDHPDLITHIQEIIEDTQMPSRCLKLEITESIVMEDIQTSLEMLKQLKALEVKISIDDFGTGYSSLSYLTQFPIDTLKIDRSFVNQMDNSDHDKAIVRTIIDLSHSLNKDVIAEGIETEKQHLELRELGVEYGQGYLYAKPLAEQDAVALLANHPTW